MTHKKLLELQPYAFFNNANQTLFIVCHNNRFVAHFPNISVGDYGCHSDIIRPVVIQNILMVSEMHDHFGLSPINQARGSHEGIYSFVLS